MELIPPQGADVEGVFQGAGIHNGRIIYTEVVPDIDAIKASSRVKRENLGVDDEGETIWGAEIWKKHTGSGEKMYPMLVKDGTLTKKIRYVLNPQEVGRNVKKVYNFEPTPEEIEALAVKDAERNFFEEFVQAAVAEGMTAAEVVQRIKRDTLGEGEDMEAVDIGVTTEAIEEIVADRVSADMITRDDEDDTVSVTAEPSD